MSDELTITVEDNDTTIVQVGVQGPAGADGLGFVTYADTEAMFAVTPAPPALAYITADDEYWRWSVAENTWIPAF